MDKIYTYLFVFCKKGTTTKDEVSFCAKTYVEARNLFRLWLNEERIDPNSIDILEKSIVFDQYDADYYGDKYGNPEDKESDVCDIEEDSF